jgi:hypothetical protein
VAEPDIATLAERAAAGDRSDDVFTWLTGGLQAWLRADGEVSLERCLRLPRSRDAQRRARRDRALRRAAQLVPRLTARATYIALETEWGRFVCGPLWAAWRDDDEPPAGTSELHRLLFIASREHRSSARGTLVWRQLQRIVEADDDV